jgi:hypothetical protein
MIEMIADITPALATVSDQLVLAAQGFGDQADAGSGARFFLEETPLGRFMRGFLGALGVVAVIFGGMKTITKALGANAAGAAKSLISTIVVAGILFSPTAIITLLEGIGRIVELIAQSLGS